MSASKESFGAGGHRGERPRDLRRCPHCRGGWCQGYADGTVLCKNVAAGRPHVNREGNTFYVHRPDGATVARELPVEPPPAPRASADVCDAAHGAVLPRLRLLEAHRANLRARALDDATITHNGYASLEVSGRAALARAIVEAVGADAARGVPGVVWRERDGRGWLSLGGAPGLLIPVRDLAGRIVALKVRRDEPGDGPRYLYVSSASSGGPKAANEVHVPRFRGDRAVVRVTEGELKADVITALTGTLTLSVPGVGCWAKALPVLAQLGARRVLVAFDADYRTTPAVGRALVRLVAALRAAGYAWSVETWDPAHKGLDDLLAATARAA